jgi:LysM repeat protein
MQLEAAAERFAVFQAGFPLLLVRVRICPPLKTLGGIMLLVPYAVRKNEWLGLIAKRYAVSLKQLLSYNPQIRDPDHVWVGTIIKVPIDNSIRPKDSQFPKDLRSPILGPYLRAPDGTVIHLPERVWLSRMGIVGGGWVHLTQEDLKGAYVEGVRGDKYQVWFNLSIRKSESESSRTGKEIGKDLAADGARHLGKSKTADINIMPKTPKVMSGAISVLSSLLDPTNMDGEALFLVSAENGTMTIVRITYQAGH